MNKYIDAEKIIAFLENEKAENIIGGDYSDGVLDTCDNILAFIDSLQQEQQEVDLEEAAENIYKVPFGTRAEDFIAGAEWMAEQGETVFDTIVIDGQGQRWLTDNLLQGDYDCGEEVIVQIRKK